jgi:hypothetical protein
VIAKLTRARDDWRAEQRELEFCQPAVNAPSDREAVVALRRILERIGDS